MGRLHFASNVIFPQVFHRLAYSLGFVRADHGQTERSDEGSWNELEYIVLRGHTTNVVV